MGSAMLLLALLVLLLFLLYKYFTRTHGTLERLGIPTIKPYPFVGSLVAADGGEDVANARRFGRVWGQYEGMMPQIFIGDLELAKRVLITDFDHFTDRPLLFEFDIARDMLDFLQGERWKVVRSILAPAMTSGTKIKAMMPTMNECLEDAFLRVDTKLRSGPQLQIKDDLFGPLVLDISARFSFSMKIPNLDDKSSTFVKAATAFGPLFIPSSWLEGVLLAFPAYFNWRGARLLQPALRYLVQLLRRSIKQRRADGVTNTDLVSAITDAIDNRVPTPEFRRLGITEDVLLLQGAELLMAAYDTTGTTLALAAFHLVRHPDVLSRAVEEVDGAGELSYEALQQLPLLEAVVQEALRLSSLITRHFRVCTRDWEYDGLRIPAGTAVLVPLRPFHFDPELFPEPERFLPDRWLGEQGRQLGQYSWMPFGLGPRACMGLRLAMVECKFVLAHLLRRYTIAPPTGVRPVKEGEAEPSPGYDPVLIKVEERSDR
ncbi:cytochrome P450 3A13-like [Pollicipes pollicipes]|uniref:cytochrome P450 3A13-like n=1 Tax=Pollicipes pollicipes TaxID=41117 RepID=UPI001884B037|nr:cytochrome P450 3A13-like [Pollicipes pollicipes]